MAPPRGQLYCCDRNCARRDDDSTPGDTDGGDAAFRTQFIPPRHAYAQAFPARSIAAKLPARRIRSKTGESDMSKEMFWLVLTVAMTGLFWVPYILDRTMVRGLVGAMANPSPSDKPQAAWAQRMMAAHTNAVENLVIFAPLVLAAQSMSIATPATAFACALYFWSRLAHVVVYTLGIPVLRTLSFVGGFVAQAILVLAIFKLI
jgi:uncharacterized MAPEG superfamily protein